MAFKPNDCQQLSFDDSFIALTEREKKALEKSWAKIFADEIFPAIDEERFSVLYSDKASRANTPVNVIIGARIIEELFDYSDDEIVENLMLDLHMKCAAGHVPISQSYTKSTRQCRVSFDRNHCAGCPYQKQCRPKIYKKAASFITSKNASDRAKSQRYMQSEEFGDLARLRNGVETVPSNLWKNYYLDTLPRGKQRGNFSLEVK